MRIDGASPSSCRGPQPEAREVKPVPVPAAAAQRSRTTWRPNPSLKSVRPTLLVEMQPGNIVVYKFIDEASGRLIQQIPAEQMLNLSTDPSKTGETDKEEKPKTWQPPTF